MIRLFNISVSKFGFKTYLVVSFCLLVKSMNKFFQDMMMDLNSSGLNQTQIRRPI
jgi:hypothetical protein